MKSNGSSLRISEWKQPVDLFECKIVDFCKLPDGVIRIKSALQKSIQKRLRKVAHNVAHVWSEAKYLVPDWGKLSTLA
jgi:hypothetical protein